MSRIKVRHYRIVMPGGDNRPEKPIRAVMIGDSVHDFEVAQAMGTACVLQCSGHQNRQTLAATGAPVVEDLREAAQLILG